MLHTALLHLIRGYDESYELWGGEDDDLFRRLVTLGLERRDLTSDEAFYLHQWHPEYEGIPAEGREQARQHSDDRWRWPGRGKSSAAGR